MVLYRVGKWKKCREIAELDILWSEVWPRVRYKKVKEVGRGYDARKGENGKGKDSIVMEWEFYRQISVG